MRILYVIPYPPSMVRRRPYQLIQELSARGHEVTAAAVWTGPQEKEDLHRLRAFCREVWAASLSPLRSALNCVVALPSGLPLQSAYSWQPALFHTIREKVKDPSNTFDVIHVEHLRGARYGLALREVFFGTEGRPGMVWDSVDCISLLFHLAAAHSKRALTRWVARFELPRTKRFERSLLEKFDRVLVTSDVDKQELHLLANGRPIAPIHVLPNGVDGGFFRSDEQPPREALTIIMTGKMSYHANVTMAVHFIEDILPLIRTRIPQVKVWIVGQNPTREVVRLARDPAVTVTGTVPDLRPFLARAALAVTPIAYGVGIQNKVLEAMACATPVVATPQALRGIGARPGLEVMAAEAPELFADQVIGLLTDPQRRRSLGEAGRQYVSSHHQWPTIAGQLEGIYDESRSHR